MAPRVATPVPVGQGPPPPQVSRRVSGLRGGNRGRKEVGTAFVSGVALPLGIRGHSAERGRRRGLRGGRQPWFPALTLLEGGKNGGVLFVFAC